MPRSAHEEGSTAAETPTEPRCDTWGPAMRRAATWQSGTNQGATKHVGAKRRAVRPVRRGSSDVVLDRQRVIAVP